jgi:hypothetical protein
MTPKHLRFTTIFLLLATFSFAQTDSTKQTANKWTIGTVFLSESNREYEINFIPKFFSETIVKRELDFFTLRMGVEYLKLRDKIDEYECCDQLFTDGLIHEGTIRFGVEKGILIKKHYRPYLAIDFICIKSYGDKRLSGGFAGIDIRVITNTTGFGSAACLGFEYKITDAVSIALETRLRLVFSETIVQSAGAIIQQNEQWLVNRIGALTLNFSF